MSDDQKPEKINLDEVDWQGSREFFQSLTDELRSLDDKDERYQFTWVGKRKSIIEAGAPINKTLRPDVDASKNFDTTENLYIEGDNLDALKLLQESYLGKVKMIYIDPPYNTGKDFVYHDNFTADNAQYAVASGKKDEDGNTLVAEDEFKKNERSAGRFHSDWLSMMYPRLKLARNLLTDDGVIFISIDDNEQANLKKLCDEVFGEENFLGQIYTVNNLKGRSDDEFFATAGEYLIVYSRSITTAELKGLPPTAEYLAEFDKQDEISRYKEVGLQKTGKNNRRIDRPNMYFPIYYMPETNKFSLEKESGALEIYPTPINGVDGRWRWGKDTFLKNKDTELTARDVNGVWRVYVKMRDVVDGEIRTVKAKTVWLDPKFDTGAGGRTSQELFGNKSYFDNPKPVEYIKEILTIATQPNDLILDFFSGSGTTAHAVMQLNAEDGGNRKFILVQLDEATPENSEARKAGYNTIPEIALERIRRAGKKIEKDQGLLTGKLDTGFRVLKIDSTNKKDVYKTPGETTQENLLDLVDNVKEDRTDLDLLYGVLVASALELNSPLEVVELAGKKVYKYDYFGEVSGLVACFEPEITTDLVKEIAKLKPLTAVFRESSFNTGASKVNLYETLRILSPDTEVKVV